jgi:transcriptional regulator with XRE-family HTH domain
MKHERLRSWRESLGLTQERAAELLGVHRISYINWETGNVPISKSIELASYACEIAYIAADQYAEKYPSTLNNIGLKNQTEAIGKKKIIDGFLNDKKNVMNKSLSITFLPQSFIQRVKKP